MLVTMSPAMSYLLLHLAALAALAAMTVAAYGAPPESTGRPPRFWLSSLVALAGTSAVVWVAFSGGWRADLAPALWLTVAVTLFMFVLGALRSVALARLAVVLGPYLLVLAALAAVWSHAPGATATSAAGPWLGLHIAVSVATYALFTLAAVAGTAVYLQERALKARRPTRLTALLPAVADAERLQRILMVLAAVVLGMGLLSGMAFEFVESRRLLVLSHKTFFALVAFGVMVALIVVDRASGLAGKRAARVLLLSYLFLTLAYPGVKFVTDVVLGRG